MNNTNAAKVSVKKDSRWTMLGDGPVWVCTETGRGYVIIARETNPEIWVKTSARYVLTHYVPAAAPVTEPAVPMQLEKLRIEGHQPEQSPAAEPPSKPEHSCCADPAIMIDPDAGCTGKRRLYCAACDADVACVDIRVTLRYMSHLPEVGGALRRAETEERALLKKLRDVLQDLESLRERETAAASGLWTAEEIERAKRDANVGA